MTILKASFRKINEFVSIYKSPIAPLEKEIFNQIFFSNFHKDSINHLLSEKGLKPINDIKNISYIQIKDTLYFVFNKTTIGIIETEIKPSSKFRYEIFPNFDIPKALTLQKEIKSAYIYSTSKNESFLSIIIENNHITYDSRFVNDKDYFNILIKKGNYTYRVSTDKNLNYFVKYIQKNKMNLEDFIEVLRSITKYIGNKKIKVDLTGTATRRREYINFPLYYPDLLIKDDLYNKEIYYFYNNKVNEYLIENNIVDPIRYFKNRVQKNELELFELICGE